MTLCRVQSSRPSNSRSSRAVHMSSRRPTHLPYYVHPSPPPRLLRQPGMHASAVTLACDSPPFSAPPKTACSGADTYVDSTADDNFLGHEHGPTKIHTRAPVPNASGRRAPLNPTIAHRSQRIAISDRGLRAFQSAYGSRKIPRHLIGMFNITGFSKPVVHT